jgi:catechol 2,3-dioxygenase-like lactoylglutathione lyase family enzyme
VKVTRIAHVSVNVEGSLIETRRFYTDVLGLDDLPRPEIPGVGGSWHHLGNTQLHLVDAAARGTGIDSRGPHFCVFVDDLDAAIEELNDRGIDYVRGAQGDVIQIWIIDPAGNTVELQQDRAE